MRNTSAYWTDLLDKDAAVALGPVAGPSGPYGMAVIKAPDEQEVRTLAKATR
jgi:hypothetical protein